MLTCDGVVGQNRVGCGDFTVRQAARPLPSSETRTVYDYVRRRRHESISSWEYVEGEIRSTRELKKRGPDFLPPKQWRCLRGYECAQRCARDGRGPFGHLQTGNTNIMIGRHRCRRASRCAAARFSASQAARKLPVAKRPQHKLCPWPDRARNSLYMSPEQWGSFRMTAIQRLRAAGGHYYSLAWSFTN